jgi:hypothetical protein
MTGSVRPLRCPGCDRVVAHDDLLRVQEFACCKRCETVFLVPKGTFERAFAHALGPRPSDVRVRASAPRAPRGGYRDAPAEGTERRALRLTYAVRSDLASGRVGLMFNALIVGMLAVLWALKQTTGYLVAAIIAGVLGLAHLLQLLVYKRVAATLVVERGQLLVDGTSPLATSDVERLRVIRRTATESEAASVGRLVSPEQPSLFDLVAQIRGRSVRLLTFATADRALHAEAALADALGLATLRVETESRDADGEAAAEAEAEVSAEDELDEENVRRKNRSRHSRRFG